ncbi:MAG: hypothetical protein FJ112_09400 [Deltaproteobacteria bacterium]|nr:hypothetical protein [Deltaproteobacteria bacterium]
MKKHLSLFVFFGLLSKAIFAVPEFYSLSKSIRSLGMGGAFYGLSDDEYALFYNPAGLSLRRSGTEVMLRVNGNVSSNAISGFNDFKDLGSLNINQAINRLEKHKNKPMFGNAGLLPYFVTRNLAVGVLLADTKLNFNISKGVSEIGSLADLQTEVADLTFVSDSGLVIGYAQSLFDSNLHFGANLKGLLRAGGRKAFTALQFNNNADIDLEPDKIGGTGIGIDLDLGATYEFKTLPFGILSRASLTFNNLLATDFSIAKQYQGAPKLVRTANIGWYTVFSGVSVIDNFQVLADISDISLGGENRIDFGARTGNLLKKLHLGLEMPMGRFSVRAGLNQGYLSAGLGMNFYALRLDLATYGEETGETTRRESRRYLATVALGWGSAPAPIKSKVESEKAIVPIKPVGDEIPTEKLNQKLDTPSQGEPQDSKNRDEL